VLQHLGLDLEPVAEQDHDERHGGQPRHEAGLRIEREHVQPALPERESGEHEQRGQREERAVRQPGQQRTGHQ